MPLGHGARDAEESRRSTSSVYLGRRSVVLSCSDGKLALTRIVRDVAVRLVESIQEYRENRRETVPPSLVTSPTALGPLPEVDTKDDVCFLMGNGLEHVRFGAEWTSPIPLDKRLEV